MKTLLRLFSVLFTVYVVREAAREIDRWQLVRGSLEDEGDDSAALDHIGWMLDELRKSLDAQWALWQDLDQRLRFLMGLTGAIITLSVTLGLGRGARGPVSLLCIWLAGGYILTALYFLGWAYRPRDFYRPPDPISFIEDSLDIPTLPAKLDLVILLSEAYNANQVVVDRVSRRSKFAFLLLVIAGVFAVAGVAAASLDL